MADIIGQLGRDATAAHHQHAIAELEQLRVDLSAQDQKGKSL